MFFVQQEEQVLTDYLAIRRQGARADLLRIVAHAPAETEQRRQVAVTDGQRRARPAPERLRVVAAEVEVCQGRARVEQLVRGGGFQQEFFRGGEVVSEFGADGAADFFEESERIERGSGGQRGVRVESFRFLILGEPGLVLCIGGRKTHGAA